MKDPRFVRLLGQPISALMASDVLSSLGTASEIEQVEGFNYIEFSRSGLSVDLGALLKVEAFFFNHEGISSEWATGVPVHATRNDVERLFGKPSQCGSASVLPILGKQGAWERWDYPSYSLHVQYSPLNESVAKISLMRSSAVPGAA